MFILAIFIRMTDNIKVSGLPSSKGVPSGLKGFKNKFQLKMIITYFLTGTINLYHLLHPPQDIGKGNNLNI